MFHFDLKTIIALQGYKVCKETTCSDAKGNDNVKIQIEINQKFDCDQFMCVHS